MLDDRNATRWIKAKPDYGNGTKDIDLILLGNIKFIITRIIIIHHFKVLKEVKREDFEVQVGLAGY